MSFLHARNTFKCNQLRPKINQLLPSVRIDYYVELNNGKRHLDGVERSGFIPPERRQGFRFWRAANCQHHYNRSPYFGDENVKNTWKGYDAFAQTEESLHYFEQNRDEPFLLLLSWGPPHNPYETALAFLLTQHWAEVEGELTSQQIEKELRLSFSLEHVKATEIFRAFRRWEEENKPYRIMKFSSELKAS